MDSQYRVLEEAGPSVLCPRARLICMGKGTNKSTTCVALSNLWVAAYDTLSKSDQDDLGFVTHETPFTASDVIDAVNRKREECEKRQWSYTNKSGEKILVRDLLTKVCGWLDKFQQIGDAAAQLAPGHAAIPWIAVKALIQTVIGDCQVYGSMAESLEVVANIITTYTEVEIRVLYQTSNLTKLLSSALVKLYGGALRFLARARQYYGKRMIRRVLEGVVATAKSAVKEPVLQIEKQQEEVYKLVRLVQDECIGAKLEDIVNVIKQNIDRFQAFDEERYKRLSTWINGFDTKNTFENILRSRHVGTCEWVLNLPEFCAWEAVEPSEARLFWIHGPPGFGKTYLSAWIIEYLEQRKQAPLCYFFCVADNQPTRDPYAILRSWLMQMLGQSDAVLPIMEAVYTARNKEQVLTLHGLWGLFVEIGNSIDGCTFVVDGFDESVDIDMGAGYHSSDPRNTFLRDLRESLSKTKSRVLVVSRDVSDIRECLGPEMVNPGLKKFEYQITAKDTTPDVRSFSEFMVSNKLPKKKEELRQKIAMQAAERSDGMFLWIKLLEQEISPGQNEKQLSKTVLEMPSGISEAYSREVKRIGQLPQDEKDEAVMILRWILFAVSPLQVKQLAEALVVSGDTLEDYPRDDLPDTWDDGFVDEDYVNERILGRCGSLVQLRSSSEETALADQTVHFVHFSVNEYLSRLSSATGSDQWAADLGLANPAAEEIRLSLVCLRYLTLDIFESISPNIDIFPFLSYAAWAWYYHSFHEKPTPSQDILVQARKAFSPTSLNWKVWTPLMEAKILGFDGEEAITDEHKSVTTSEGIGGSVPNPIYYASLLGLSDVVQWLADQGLDCSCEGGRFGFPLQAAVVGSHPDVVRLLLDLGANVMQRGGQCSASIVAAVGAMSTPEIVETLLNAKLDLTVADDRGCTALHIAVFRVDAATIMRSLLECGADPNLKDDRGRTTLHYAACTDRVDILQLLFEYRADPKLVDEIGYTALHVASEYGTIDMVRCLLENGAEPNSTSERNWTPLHSAAGQDIEIVRALLDAGANVSQVGSQQGSDDTRWTPLQCALAESLGPVVELLYEYGAKLDQKADYTALQYAVMYCNAESVELLLDLGASMAFIEEDSQRTLFDLVMMEERRDIGELLICRGCFRERGANNIRRKTVEPTHGMSDAESNGNLSILAFKGDFKDLETFLLDSKDSLPPSDLDEGLRIASVRGNLSSVETLLHCGAAVDECDINGRTALHHAVLHLHFDVADVLVERGASVVVEDDNGSAPFDLAVAHGNRALEFIQKQMDSFTNNICRRESLQSHTSDSSLIPEISMLALKARHGITGLWVGYEEYDSWWKGRRDPFSIHIPAAPPQGPFTFNGTSVSELDATTQFQFVGFTDPSGIIWFIGLSDDHGWFYRGELEMETGEVIIKGTWGKNRKLWFGSFRATITSET